METQQPQSTPEKSWAAKEINKPPNGLIEVPATSMNPLNWLLARTVTIHDSTETQRFVGCQRDGVRAVKDLQRGKRGWIVLGDTRLPNISVAQITNSLHAPGAKDAEPETSLPAVVHRSTG